ncbi:hypothetical protein V5O48_017644 [Marasmius crinis-equi]|uniref:Cytochrome P450 n=1 Tax=Marasmius crinis-equi TaxID=585013 RepID=A0ABR3END1_9AGAR
MVLIDILVNSSFFPAHYFALLFFSLFIIYEYIASTLARNKLASIPALNSWPTSNPLWLRLPFLAEYYIAWRFFVDSRVLIEEGCRKYPSTPFKVPTFEGWLVILNGPEALEDIRKATDEDFSVLLAINDSLLKMEYTIHPKLHMNLYHIRTIRTSLTRNIGTKLPETLDEIRCAFQELVPPSHDWTEPIDIVSNLEDIIVRVSNRYYVGLPLCRNSDYCNLIFESARSVLVSAQIIGMFPRFLQPIAGRIFTMRKSNARRAVRHLAPLIQERRCMRKEARPLGFIYALGYLAANPQLAGLLRDEIEAATRNGWNKAALNQVPRLDSFLKEALRHSGSLLGAPRTSLRDFPLTGSRTVIPAHTKVAVANYRTHFDPVLYPEPAVFNPVRFYDPEGGNKEGYNNSQMVTPTSDWPFFGVGKHTCPGRFFVVNEIKTLLAHVLVTYDVKFHGDPDFNGSERGAARVPPSAGYWAGITLLLDARLRKLTFRKRRDI